MNGKTIFGLLALSSVCFAYAAGAINAGGDNPTAAKDEDAALPNLSAQAGADQSGGQGANTNGVSTVAGGDASPVADGNPSAAGKDAISAMPARTGASLAQPEPKFATSAASSGNAGDGFMILVRCNNADEED